MRCSRCNSSRIQRDYDDALIVVRMAGLQRMLCNNCGLVFQAFDPFGKIKRAPSKKSGQPRNLRRAPRFAAHLPVGISLIEGKARVGKVAYSQPSRGHCETISRFGMSLSCVGTRFPESELSRIGRLLFVRVDLPEGSIEAVVSIINSVRVGEDEKRRWILGVRICQISDADKKKLGDYLELRAKTQPLVIAD